MRSDLVKLRATPDQAGRWRAAAGERGLSEWIRGLADVAAASGADVALLRGELAALRADLNRGPGNALNQIARALNTHIRAGELPNAAAHERGLAAAADDLAALRRGVERALRVLARKRTP